MSQITISFTSDDPDEIALIVAAWDLIQKENVDDEPSYVAFENYLRLNDIWKAHAIPMYTFAKQWDSDAAKILLRMYPDLAQKSEGK